MDNSGLFGEIKLSAGSMSELRELCEDLDLDHITALIVNGVRFLKVNVDDLQLEDIKIDMCDNYCSKRKEWTGDQDDLIEEICVCCPLTRL